MRAVSYPCICHSLIRRCKSSWLQTYTINVNSADFTLDLYTIHVPLYYLLRLVFFSPLLSAINEHNKLVDKHGPLSPQECAPSSTSCVRCSLGRVEVSVLCLSTGHIQSTSTDETFTHDISDAIQNTNINILNETNNILSTNATRVYELYQALSVWGIPSSAVHVIDHPLLQDGMHSSWDHNVISNFVIEEVYRCFNLYRHQRSTENQPSSRSTENGYEQPEDHETNFYHLPTFQVNLHVVTFDDYGVSGHLNHIDTRYGIQSALQNIQQTNAMNKHMRDIRGSTFCGVISSSTTTTVHNHLCESIHNSQKNDKLCDNWSRDNANGGDLYITPWELQSHRPSFMFEPLHRPAFFKKYFGIFRYIWYDITLMFQRMCNCITNTINSEALGLNDCSLQSSQGSLSTEQDIRKGSFSTEEGIRKGSFSTEEDIRKGSSSTEEGIRKGSFSTEDDISMSIDSNNSDMNIRHTICKAEDPSVLITEQVMLSNMKSDRQLSAEQRNMNKWIDTNACHMKGEMMPHSRIYIIDLLPSKPSIEIMTTCPTCTWNAMKKHITQWEPVHVWYRKLHVIFSMYTYFNVFVPISVLTNGND